MTPWSHFQVGWSIRESWIKENKSAPLLCCILLVLGSAIVEEVKQRVLESQGQAFIPQGLAGVADQ